MDFSPRVNFQCRLSCSVHKALCAIPYSNICAHIKNSNHWQPHCCLDTWNYCIYRQKWVKLPLRLLCLIWVKQPRVSSKRQWSTELSISRNPSTTKKIKNEQCQAVQPAFFTGEDRQFHFNLIKYSAQGGTWFFTPINQDSYIRAKYLRKTFAKNIRKHTHTHSQSSNYLVAFSFSQLITLTSALK